LKKLKIKFALLATILAGIFLLNCDNIADKHREKPRFTSATAIVEFYLK